MIRDDLLAARRLVGNHKVPPDQRFGLRYVKAIRQGMQCGHTRLLPAIESLPPVVREAARAEVRDRIVWDITLPRYTADGRRIR